MSTSNHDPRPALRVLLEYAEGCRRHEHRRDECVVCWAQRAVRAHLDATIPSAPAEPPRTREPSA